MVSATLSTNSSSGHFHEGDGRESLHRVYLPHKFTETSVAAFVKYLYVDVIDGAMMREGDPALVSELAKLMGVDFEDRVVLDARLALIISYSIPTTRETDRAVTISAAVLRTGFSEDRETNGMIEEIEGYGNIHTPDPDFDDDDDNDETPVEKEKKV